MQNEPKIGEACLATCLLVLVRAARLRVERSLCPQVHEEGRPQRRNGFVAEHTRRGINEACETRAPGLQIVRQQPEVIKARPRRTRRRRASGDRTTLE